MNSTATLGVRSHAAAARLNRAGSAPSRSTLYAQMLVYVFLGVQFVSQSALIIEEPGEFRKVLRAVGYGSSLLMLVLLYRLPARPNPMRGLTIAFLGILGLEFFHPYGNTAVAGAAEVMINVAVWCPVLWCAHVNGSAKFMRNVLLIFWLSNVAGAVVGVLQVYYPQQFSPSPDFIRKLIGQNADGLRITLTDGSKVWRPMGLSDAPGGASVAGSFAVLFGLAIAVTETNFLIRVITMIGATAGMFCIYICETRSILVMTVIGMIVYLIMMAARKRLTRLAFLGFAAVVVSLVGFYWAFSIGGSSFVKRAGTLTDQAPVEVYYQSRGHFLERTFDDLLPKFPLGAGLGRWGMIGLYFGDSTIPDSETIWVEIQLTGWLLDGGVPLVIIGYLALFTACWASARLAMRGRDPNVADMAAVVTGVNLALLAITFNCPIFISQIGISFWVLNGLLHASAGEEPLGVARPLVAA